MNDICGATELKQPLGGTLTNQPNAAALLPGSTFINRFSKITPQRIAVEIGYLLSYCRKDISADTLFSQLGDFAVSRVLIFADAGTEHSTSTLLFYCRNEKTAVSISLVIEITCPQKYPVLQYYF